MQYVHHLPECVSVQELEECASAWRTGPSCLGLVCPLAHVQNTKSHGYAHMLHLSSHVTPCCIPEIAAVSDMLTAPAACLMGTDAQRE